jgi:hypothetical protein
LPSVKSKPSSLTRRGGSTVTLPVIPMNTRTNHTRTRTRLHSTQRERDLPLSLGSPSPTSCTYCAFERLANR